MQPAHARHTRYSIALLDLISLNICYAVVVAVLDTVAHSVPYMILSVVINLCWIISSYSTALYIGLHGSHNYFLKKTLKAFCLFLSLILFFIFFYHYSYSRLFVMLSFVGFFCMLVVSRSILLFVDHFKNHLTVQKNVVILGSNDTSERLVKHFESYNNKINVRGFFDDDNITKLNGTPMLGNFTKVIDYSVNNQVHEIYSTISPERNPHLYEMAEEAEKNYIRFKYVPDFRLFVNRAMHVELEKDIPVLSMRADPLEDESNKFKKRLFDVVFSCLVALLVFSWLMPIIALLIKLTSRGPVFFTQLRSGKNNKSFYCYKFRSLKESCDCDKKQVCKTDDRFTPIGRFLRKTNLDELPQFFNVLQNSMSVIGPRPHMLQHTTEWSKVCKQYMLRHYLKPGITGWAQVNGFRGEVKGNELLVKRIEHDIWYMENWSMWLDLRIVLLSIVKTVVGDKLAV